MQIVDPTESGLPSTFPVARDSGYYNNVSALLLNAHDNQLQDRPARYPGITLSSGRTISMSCSEGCVSMRPSLYLTKACQSDLSLPMATAQADCTIHGDTGEIMQAMRNRLYRAVGRALQDEHQEPPASSASTSTHWDAVDARKGLESFCGRVAAIYCGNEADPRNTAPDSQWNEQSKSFSVLDSGDKSHAAALSKLQHTRTFPEWLHSPDDLLIRDDTTCVGLTDEDGMLTAMSFLGLKRSPEGTTAVIVPITNASNGSRRFGEVAHSDSIYAALRHLLEAYTHSVLEIAAQGETEVELPITPIAGLAMSDIPEMFQSLTRAYAGLIRRELADPTLKVEVISLDALNGSHLTWSNLALDAVNEAKNENGIRHFDILPSPVN